MSRRSGRGTALNRWTPVFRRVSDSPDISLRIESGADQEILAVAAQRQTAGYPRRDTPAPRQIAQENRSFDLQRARAPKPAALAAHNHRHTPFSERTNPVQTGYADGNLHAYPRAPSRRFRCRHFHLAALFGRGWQVLRAPPRRLTNSSLTDYRPIWLAKTRRRMTNVTIRRDALASAVVSNHFLRAFRCACDTPACNPRVITVP